MIPKDIYNEWRNHPATLFFRQFLKDRKEMLIRQVTEDWLNSGTINEVDRGRILEVIEVEDIPYQVIETFYREKNASEDNLNPETAIHSSPVQRQE